MTYMTLLEFADLLADILDFKDITAGCIDASKTDTIGVYQRGEFVPRECIGTESSYETAKLRILIRCGLNPSEAEKTAAEVGAVLQALRDMPTHKHIIKFAHVRGIRSIGKDEKGVCEYIADADVIYTERNDI